MIDANLIEILRCPQDRSRLRIAAPEIVDQINDAINSGKAMNVAGERLSKRIDGGLVREAGDLLYPVVDDIPVMLPDEAIALKEYE